jgi:hypothetical protein
MRQVQFPGINYVFKKDEKGYYTKSALLYQDILRYAIFRKINKLSDDPFRHWDLAEWLMKNNNEFINRYKASTTTISNRIEYTQNRTKDSLRDLVYLGLIVDAEQTKIKKGTATTSLYLFTDTAYLIAWIIEGFDPNKRENADNEIYNLFDSNYKRKLSPSSYDIFNWALYKKYKEKGVFGSFVVDEFRRRLDSNVQTRDMRGLFHRIGVIYNNNIDQARFFVDLWNETLDELNPEARNLVLHHIKLERERRMEDIVEDLADFEKTRFESRNRYDEVALEGNCTKCKRCYSNALPLRPYLDLVNILPSEPVTANCILCKDQKSFEYKTIKNWD